jgi:hypothetical protein
MTPHPVVVWLTERTWQSTVKTAAASDPKASAATPASSWIMRPAPCC